MRTVTVAAGSRLHFGMFSFGQPHVRQFGGVGAMIDSPGLRLSISPAEQFTVAGPLAERVRRTAIEIYARLKPELDPQDNTPRDAPACAIMVEQAPREHTGLGVGTQLSLSVASGLRAYFKLPSLDATALARLAGRGERSAVGTYGFEQGGLIVEAGRSRDVSTLVDNPTATVELKPIPAFSTGNSPLIARTSLPAHWRFVLFIRRERAGLSGDAEQRAFATLPPVPLTTTDRLTRLAVLDLIPAAVEQNFTRFSDALYQYGLLAGECFAAQQHGAFADEETAALVARLRRQRVTGVGQTSWGPAVFTLIESHDRALDLIDRLHEYINEPRLLDQYEIVLSSPMNHGAVVR